MHRKSPMTRAPGSWTWPVASPRTWVTPQSFGRSRRWPRMSARTRTAQALRDWLARARPPYGPSPTPPNPNPHKLKPHRVRYYLERRDAQFERKMAQVLMVYHDVNLYQADAVHDARPTPIYTVSVDEKPGVQALGVTAPDLAPV